MRVGVMIGSRFKDKSPEVVPFGDSSIAKRRMSRGKKSSVAAEGGEESIGGSEPSGSGELQSGDGGQP